MSILFTGPVTHYFPEVASSDDNDQRTDDLLQDTISDRSVMYLARDSKDVVDQLLREPVNHNDELMLAQIDETIENAQRARDIVATRLAAKDAIALPFASAA